MSHNERDYAGMLRARGYRVTPQRRMVLDAVCEGGGHLTLDEVHARLEHKDPPVSLSTLYRALDFLVNQQLVVAAQRSDGKTVYEIARPAPHHHLVCRACGAELEISHTEVEKLYDRIRTQYDFSLDCDHLTLRGLCRKCAQSA
ncbi:MAG TPA: Fur family transcriptional regulator [Anaerolineaceae bacterium]|nr:Fur family transcriptional regulator [Anaerolineaceae bacterium]